MRIRTIKPEFWLHEGLCNCSEFSRLLAIALLNWSDDEGYFMAHPSLLRGSLFPFLDDSKKIPGSLQELSRVGWIELGEDDQRRPVGRVLNFAKHQRVDKPQASKIKASSTFQDHSKIIPRTLLEPSKGEGKGMEGERNGEQRGNEPPPQPKPAIPDSFDQFWQAYPNKTGKANALKIWERDKPSLETVLAALAWQKRQDSWTKDNGKFIPHASTYLNGKRYEDEKPKPPPRESCLGLSILPDPRRHSCL